MNLSFIINIVRLVSVYRSVDNSITPGSHGHQTNATQVFQVGQQINPANLSETRFLMLRPYRTEINVVTTDDGYILTTLRTDPQHSNKDHDLDPSSRNVDDDGMNATTGFLRQSVNLCSSSDHFAVINKASQSLDTDRKNRSFNQISKLELLPGHIVILANTGHNKDLRFVRNLPAITRQHDEHDHQKSKLARQFHAMAAILAAIANKIPVDPRLQVASIDEPVLATCNTATLTMPGSDVVQRSFLCWLMIDMVAPAAAIQDSSPKAQAPSSKPQLIIVSNRLPAAPSSSDRQRQVGGLVSALEPVLTETNGMWLGWSGVERETGLQLRIEPGMTRAEFDYPKGWRRRFYNGFCNQSLWPLLHGFSAQVRYLTDEWRCYVDANRAYAHLVLEAAGGSNTTTVWVQDFHLMLVGRELRSAGHRGRIGFYLHVPFPSLDCFETMPWAREIVSALLDYDLVGFQSRRSSHNFVATVGDLLGGEAQVRARDRSLVIPVGIYPDRFAETATTRLTAEPSELGSLEAQGLKGHQLILGVDRLDYIKGIPERLEAFARLLERYPRWRGKVSFIQVSVPTRMDVPEYAELRSRVESLVSRINGAFGEADWTPVRYLYRSYDQATLARLYRLAAVGVVTSLRDGMNLVAKEYVASQNETDPGVLVLSKFCGAAERMKLAMLTNPYHVENVAANLDAALSMPRIERIRRNSALRACVWRDTASAWAKTFLARLLQE